MPIVIVGDAVSEPFEGVGIILPTASQFTSCRLLHMPRVIVGGAGFEKCSRIIEKLWSREELDGFGMECAASLCFSFPLTVKIGEIEAEQLLQSAAQSGSSLTERFRIASLLETPGGEKDVVKVEPLIFPVEQVVDDLLHEGFVDLADN